MIVDATSLTAKLQSLGTESTKRILMKHGAQEPVFGVKIEEMKKLQKQIKKDYRLALDLFDTGIYDAQYLAGLIADDEKMTRRDLDRWLKRANCSAISCSVVAWAVAESRFGWEVALDWIEKKDSRAAQVGWHALSSYVSITDDDELDLAVLKRLLQQVQKTIHKQPDGVRYAMNDWVIALGVYVEGLSDAAIKAALAIGTVEVDMGPTACQVPHAPAYIQKAKARGVRKRKTARC
jgi:hypothetical protein